jgi:hypothetical protein
MRLLRWLGYGVAALVLAVSTLFGVDRFLDGPLGPVPGGPLKGAVATEDPGEWSFTGDRKTLELQVGERSVTIWFAVREGTLYLAAADGARKRWTGEAVADGRVRLRVAGRLYERTLVRLLDEAQLRAVGDVFKEKYDVTISPEEGALVWMFRVDPRS